MYCLARDPKILCVNPAKTSVFSGLATGNQYCDMYRPLNLSEPLLQAYTDCAIKSFSTSFAA